MESPPTAGGSEYPKTSSLLRSVEEKKHLKRIATGADSLQGFDRIRHGSVPDSTKKIIADVWTKISEHIQRASAVPEHGRVCMDDERINNEIALCDTVVQGTNFLGKQMKRTLGAILQPWYVDRRNGQGSAEQVSDFDNLQISLTVTKSVSGYDDIFSHIGSGLQSACTEPLRMIAAVPGTFRDQFGARIKPSQYFEIAENSLPMIYSLANRHINILQNYVNCVGDGHMLSTGLRKSPGLFVISGTPPNSHMELSDHAAEQIGDCALKGSDSQFHGCPAMYVAGTQHPTVIAELYHDWILPIVQKFLMPHVHRLKDHLEK